MDDVERPGGPTTEVWLVRHGETEWSREGRHTSTTDVPLTEAGAAVATGLAHRLASESFGQVLTSPRQRVRRTAELAGFPDAHIDEDLAEWDYGDYEGLTTEQIRETVPDWTVWTHECPGGETAAQVARRLDRVVAKALTYDGRVLVFGHGHALRVLTARWLGQQAADGRLYRLDTGTVGVLGHERETPVLRRWNC